MQHARSRTPVAPWRPALPSRRPDARLLSGALLSVLTACLADPLPTSPAGPAALTGGPVQAVAMARALPAPRGLALTDLGTLPGSASSRASAINARGDVVGGSTGGVEHAFLWTARGGFVDLGTLGGLLSHAQDINARGDIVGTSTTASGHSHALLWRDGQIIDLGTLPGGLESSAAEDISNNGIVVGISGGIGFVWTASEGMRPLPPLPGFDLSGAYAVNERGEIVGFSSSRSGTPSNQATLWSPDGTPTPIPRPPGTSYTTAVDVNARGEVLVTGVVGDRGVAFVWTRQGGFVEVSGFEPGRSSTSAYAIGARGEVVGSSGIAGAVHAFVWTAERGAVDLGTLPGADWSEAFDINARGEIVGMSYVAPIGIGVPFHVVLWQPRATHD